MRRMLLVSTAALGLASLPALAQQAEPVPPVVTGPGAAAPAEAPAAATAGAPAPKPIPEQAEHQVRAQSLLGVNVSNGQDTIGKVSDLVVTDDGRVDAIVVGVGGFLGIGKKRVALAWDSAKLTEQDGGRAILVSVHSSVEKSASGIVARRTAVIRRAVHDDRQARERIRHVDLSHSCYRRSCTSPCRQGSGQCHRAAARLGG